MEIFLIGVGIVLAVYLILRVVRRSPFPPPPPGTEAKTFHLKVVGVTKNNPDGGKRQKIISKCYTGELMALVREPDNPYDEFAVAVYRLTGEQIGYLPMEQNQDIFRVLDCDERADARIAEIRGGTDEKPNLGVVLEITKYV